MMTLDQPAFDFTQPLTLRERAEQFHRDNTHVVIALEALARPLIAAGHNKFGIALLWENLRYESMISTEDRNSYRKLNNDYRSYYARLLIERNPSWESVIEVRELRSK